MNASRDKLYNSCSILYKIMLIFNVSQEVNMSRKELKLSHFCAHGIDGVKLIPANYSMPKYFLKSY